MAEHSEVWKTLRWVALLATIVILCLIGIKVAERSVDEATTGARQDPRRP